MSTQLLQQHITSYCDFPKEGVVFRDISPLFANPKAFAYAVDAMIAQTNSLPFNKVVAIDARGFLFGSVLAHRLQKGLVLCRKPSKLPGELVTESYGYEYSTGSLSIQRDAITPEDHVLIVDDVLATGNTALAAYKIVTKLEGVISGVVCLIELTYLNGRRLLTKHARGTTIESILCLTQ